MLSEATRTHAKKKIFSGETPEPPLPRGGGIPPRAPPPSHFSPPGGRPSGSAPVRTFEKYMNFQNDIITTS